MASCIVCKAYFDPGSRTGAWCSRCDTNNREWRNWRRRNPVEQGGLRGLLAFTKPHVHLPLVVTALATCFGLIAVFMLWLDIKPGFRAIALLVTPVGCLLSLEGAYGARMQIRESELLRQVKRGWRKGFSAQTLTLLLPAGAVAAVLILTYALIKVEDLWELVKWLALIRPPDTGDSLPEKLLAVLPFVSMVGYIMLAISFTASSALMLTRRYINQLNKFLPHPIFLQDEKLAQIVRREAEVELGRLDPQSTNVSIMSYIQVEGQIAPQQLLLPPTVNMPVAAGAPVPPQVDLRLQAATWTWDELARTDDGGVEMKVARQEIYQLPKPVQNPGHRPHPRVRYLVRADPWGHITKIKRDVEEA